MSSPGIFVSFSIIRFSSAGFLSLRVEGQGATFKIYLPRALETAPVKDHFEADRKAPTGHETILVVEDSEAVRTLVTEALQTQGYTVLVAVDGEDALRVAAAFPDPIQLLLTDLVMPHLNGSLLAEQLNLAYPDLKILFMSGYTDHTLDRTGLSQAKVNFLQKPFSPIVLTQQVRQILDAHLGYLVNFTPLGLEWLVPLGVMGPWLLFIMYTIAWRPHFSMKLSWAGYGTAVLIVIVIWSLLSTGTASFRTARHAQFTEFFVTQEEARPDTLTFNVVNRLSQPATFTLTMTTAGVDLQTLGPQSLEPDSAWSLAWPVPPQVAGEKLVITLKKDGLPYRQLRLSDIKRAYLAVK